MTKKSKFAAEVTKALRFVLVLAAIIGVGWIAVSHSADRAADPSPVVPVTSVSAARVSMPSLEGAVDWLNAEPLSAQQLKGKVVLVDFWTFSCINWHRTLPYVRAWVDKYQQHGLVVLGVHTPEFDFEKDIGRVREASAQLRVGYPVAVDSEYKVWRAFDNNYWPALYLVDARGRIRHQHFGEGGYERSEKLIQQLLVEAGAKNVPGGLVEVNGTGTEAQADWSTLRSPETYVGHQRTSGFTSPGGQERGSPKVYAAPQHLRLNTWALQGEWTVGPEAAVLQQRKGRISFQFHARDLHLVMGPAERGKAIAFRVLIDGQPPGPAHGSDIDADGRGALTQHKLYQLIRQPGEVKDRLFEIEFLEPGAEAYSFTFG